VWDKFSSWISIKTQCFWGVVNGPWYFKSLTRFNSNLEILDSKGSVLESRILYNIRILESQWIFPSKSWISGVFLWVCLAVSESLRKMCAVDKLYSLHGKSTTKVQHLYIYLWLKMKDKRFFKKKRAAMVQLNNFSELQTLTGKHAFWNTNYTNQTIATLWAEEFFTSLPKKERKIPLHKFCRISFEHASAIIQRFGKSNY